MRLGVSVFKYGAVGGHKNGAYLKAPLHFEICCTCSPGSYSVACRHSFLFAGTVTNTECGFGGVDSRQIGRIGHTNGVVSQGRERFLKWIGHRNGAVLVPAGGNPSLTRSQKRSCISRKESLLEVSFGHKNGAWGSRIKFVGEWCNVAQRTMALGAPDWSRD